MSSASGVALLRSQPVAEPLSLKQLSAALKSVELPHDDRSDDSDGNRERTSRRESFIVPDSEEERLQEEDSPPVTPARGRRARAPVSKRKLVIDLSSSSEADSSDDERSVQPIASTSKSSPSPQQPGSTSTRGDLSTSASMSDGASTARAAWTVIDIADDDEDGFDPNEGLLVYEPTPRSKRLVNVDSPSYERTPSRGTPSRSVPARGTPSRGGATKGREPSRLARTPRTVINLLSSSSASDSSSDDGERSVPSAGERSEDDELPDLVLARPTTPGKEKSVAKRNVFRHFLDIDDDWRSSPAPTSPSAPSGALTPKRTPLPRSKASSETPQSTRRRGKRAELGASAELRARAVSLFAELDAQVFMPRWVGTRRAMEGEEGDAEGGGLGTPVLIDDVEMEKRNGGTAEHAFGTVRIEWNKRLRSTAGRAGWKRSTSGNVRRHKLRVELSTKVLDTEDKLKETLAHEMCHLAAWVLSNEIACAHGPAFKLWGERVMRLRKDIKVTTRHNYAIEYRFAWRCTGRHCGALFQRHSKSIDVRKVACGACGAQLELIRS